MKLRLICDPNPGTTDSYGGVISEDPIRLVTDNGDPIAGVESVQFIADRGEKMKLQVVFSGVRAEFVTGEGVSAPSEG